MTLVKPDAKSRFTNREIIAAIEHLSASKGKPYAKEAGPAPGRMKGARSSKFAGPREYRKPVR